MTAHGTAGPVEDAGGATAPRPELVLAGVTKTFGGTVAVDSVHLAVSSRDFVTVLGPSGCGKTTLLRMIGGFLRPDSGQIFIGGEDMSSTPVERRPTAMLFQGYSLWPHMSVSRNIGFGLELRRRRRREIRARVDELLELVGLEGYGDRYPHQLSGGQQQRVALARSLALEPRILLLDEPFSSLDLRLRLELRNAVREIQRRVGTTTVLVTHDQDEALELSDHIVVMSKGHVEQIGSPAEIYERPQTRFVAEFIGTMNFFEGRASQLAVALGDSLLVPVGEPPLAIDVVETFGVRPEDIAVEVDGGAGARAVVENVTLHGHYKELRLRAGGVSLRAYASKDLGAEAGDDVRFSFRRVRSFGDGPQAGRAAATSTEEPGAGRALRIPGAMGAEPEGR